MTPCDACPFAGCQECEWQWVCQVCGTTADETHAPLCGECSTWGNGAGETIVLTNGSAIMGEGMEVPPRAGQAPGAWTTSEEWT